MGRNTFIVRIYICIGLRLSADAALHSPTSDGPLLVTIKLKHNSSYTTYNKDPVAGSTIKNLSELLELGEEHGGKTNTELVSLIYF